MKKIIITEGNGRFANILKKNFYGKNRFNQRRNAEDSWQQLKIKKFFWKNKFY